MARKTRKKKRAPLCRGGGSHACRRGAHEAGLAYRCRSCGGYMGCSKCAQKVAELFCLDCGDWALDAGERRHGRPVRDRAAAAAMARGLARDAGK